MDTKQIRQIRLELKDGINSCTLVHESHYKIDDLEGIDVALQYLNHHKKYANRTLIVSDLSYTENESSLAYSKLAKIAQRNNIRRIYAIGVDISDNAMAFKWQNDGANTDESEDEEQKLIKPYDFDANFYRSIDEFIQNVGSDSFKNELIFIAGNKEQNFERITHSLQKRAHRTVLEVNLNAIEHNLNYFKNQLKKTTKLMVMTKAFSYGSGADHIANFLEYQKTDYLGVAVTEEGVELRDAGISIPIVVMNPEIESFDDLIRHNLEPAIYNYRILDAFNEALKEENVKKYPIHLKIDTGMRRLGFDKDDIENLITRLQGYDNILLKSIFSHLVGTDDTQHDEYTRQQFQRFQEMSSRIICEFPPPVMRHILNSNGIDRFPEAQYDMVRLGIGLYGAIAENQDKIKNISTFKTRISQIKHVPKDQTIGYSRNGILERDSKIATLPVGYGDGFRRKLGNKLAKVFVNGEYAPVIGNICMDMCMIDITDIEAKEGDEVIIFGEPVSILELAEKLDTIPYEILTSIDRRVKRTYTYTIDIPIE